MPCGPKSDRHRTNSLAQSFMRLGKRHNYTVRDCGHPFPRSRTQIRWLVNCRGHGGIHRGR